MATSKLPIVRDDLIHLLSLGNTDKVACESVGITPASLYNWINRGKREIDRVNENPKQRSVRQGEQLYVDFFEAVTRARANAHRLAVDALQSAIAGNRTVNTRSETRTETRTTKNGSTYKVTYSIEYEDVTEHPPDWRAALEYLKRRDPESWSDKVSVDHSGGINVSLDSAKGRLAALLAKSAESEGDGDAG